MTAVNIFTSATEAHVFTDGAYFSVDNGELQSIESKPFPFPHLNAVLAVQGLDFIPRVLGLFVGTKGYQDFDGLSDNFAGIVRECIPEAVKIGAPASWGPFRAYLVGWSDRESKPVTRAVYGHKERGIPAFTLFTPQKVIHPLADNQTYLFDHSNPAQSGLALMNIQRGMWRAIGGQNVSPDEMKKNLKATRMEDRTDAHRVVGRFCQHTIITRDSTTMRVLERWPDKIGERINPVVAQASS